MNDQELIYHPTGIKASRAAFCCLHPSEVVSVVVWRWLDTFDRLLSVHLISVGKGSELFLCVPPFFIYYDSVYGIIKFRTDLCILGTAYFHGSILSGTCNALIYVSSFLKFISHRSLLNRMRIGILWLNFCFPDTAPICISAVAFRISLLIAFEFLLSLSIFLRKLLLKTPVWHLSWRSQSICNCHVEMDLNYSIPIFNLLMGYWCRETEWSHSLCSQSPWHESSHEISSPLSQMVFFALRLTQTF